MRESKSLSRPPPERRVFPIKVLDLCVRFSGKLLVDIDSLALAIAHLHPEQEAGTANENGAASSEVQAIANAVVGAVKRQEAPRGNQTANVAEHNDGANGRGSGGVGDDVGRSLGVAESAEGEGAGRNEEGCCIANHQCLAGQKHCTDESVSERIWGMMWRVPTY